MRKHLGEIFEEAAAKNSDEETIEFIRQHYSPQMKMLISFMFDKKYEFRIKKIPTDKFKISQKPHPEYFWSNLILEMRRMHLLLKGRNEGLSDEAVSNLIFSIYDSLANSEQKLLKGLIEKRKFPQKKFTRKFMQKVFPEIFDEIDKENVIEKVSEETSSNTKKEFGNKALNRSSTDLSVDEVKEIRKLCKEKNLTQKEIAGKFEITQSIVSKIKARQARKDVE